MKKLLAIMALVGWMIGCMAQEDVDGAVLPHYTYHLDSTTIMLGDQTMLTVEPGETYPTMDELTGNDIMALRQWIDTATGNQHTVLTSFEEGEHWLHVGDDSVLLTVNDVAGVDTSKVDIRDIAGIMRQPYTAGELLSVIGGVVLFWAIVAGIVLLYVYLKRRKPPEAQAQQPHIKPDIKALNGLEELRKRQMWQQGKTKEYHTELTDILRNYLEEAFGIQSTEMTTEQTLEAFGTARQYSSESENLLRQILQRADMVKFAKSEPAPYQHDLSMSQAVEFVRQTVPIEEPEAAAEPEETKE